MKDWVKSSDSSNLMLLSTSTGFANLNEPSSLSPLLEPFYSSLDLIVLLSAEPDLTVPSFSYSSESDCSVFFRLLFFFGFLFLKMNLLMTVLFCLGYFLGWAALNCYIISANAKSVRLISYSMVPYIISVYIFNHVVGRSVFVKNFFVQGEIENVWESKMNEWVDEWVR